MGERRQEDLLLAMQRQWPWARQLVTATCLLLGLLAISVQLDLWRHGGCGTGCANGRRYAAGWRHSEPPSHTAAWPGVSPPLFSISPLAPSREIYYSVQARPDLVQSDPSLAEEFAAAPWLLPPRTPALPYAGVHELDRLLPIMSRPAGNHSKSVAILLFNKGYAVMAQNSIYSLVKHGGVRNYIAVTWTQQDFEACLDLNLPCADVADMLVEPLYDLTRPRQHDFVVMTWIKPAVVLRALKQGYVVMSVDTDVSYSVKPVWDSYLEYLAWNAADGAWQAEGPINSGHFVLLPTPAAIRFAEAWVATAPDNVKQLVAEQKALTPLDRKHYITCRSPCMCWKERYKLKEQKQEDQIPLFASYYPAHTMYTQAGCTIGSKAWAPHVDPCDWAILFVHPICAQGAAIKEGIMREAGFWFMDNEEGCHPQPEAASQVPACRPLQWRLPQTEAAHYSCRSYSLGLVHGQMPEAVAALRAGATAEEAKQLLHLSADKDCNGKNDGTYWDFAGEVVPAWITNAKTS